MLDIFDGKISLEEIEEMDLPMLNSLVEAKLQLIAERDKAHRKSAKLMKQ